MPDMMSWILQGQVLIDSEEESSDSEDEEEIISDRRFLRGASPPNEGFSRLLGEWFVQRGKKRCHPQDTLSPFHNREEVHHQPTKRQQRGSLRIVKIDDDESEGSTSSEKTETLNLANPSQCVEELRSSGLTDIFLQKLKPYLEKSPLEFIRMGGIPVLVERILQSYQEEGFPKTKDLVSCFQSTYEGLENYLETLSNSSKNRSDEILLQTLLSAFQPLKEDLEQRSLSVNSLEPFFSSPQPSESLSTTLGSSEIQDAISQAILGTDETVLTKQRVKKMLEGNCSKNQKWQLEFILFRLQYQVVFDAVRKIPLGRSEVRDLYDFGLFLLSHKLRDVESTNEQLSWEDSENSEFATINVNISLAILHAVVILMGDKVDLLESRFESEESNNEAGEQLSSKMKEFVEESKQETKNYEEEFERLSKKVQEWTKNQKVEETQGDSKGKRES